MVQISNIQKSYGKNRILEHIEFEVSCGERVAIVGRNGCGKTTLMQILAGIIKPDSGQIRYFGKEPLLHKKYFQRFCGYVPQGNPLFEELTVRDNLRLWGVDRSKFYDWIIRYFDLEGLMKTSVEKLSGGMKRRLCIACALAEWPPVMLLDEPTTALDLFYKESIHEWFDEYKKMNGIIIMTTHDFQEIQDSDRCLIMRDGQVTEVQHKNVIEQQMKQWM